MRVICVDDEELLVEEIAEMCLELDQVNEVRSFTVAADALKYLETESAEVALLDINMPEMDGISLAKRIREIHPETRMIFLTGYAKYALDAYSVHPSGYLLKPVRKAQLAEEISWAARDIPESKPLHIEARTFGYFDLLVDGTPIAFRSSRSKELLACLIDRHGAFVPRREAFALLWEDCEYTRSMQKQFDAVIRNLRAILEEHGIGDIIETKSGNMRIRPELIACDAWRFMENDPEAVHAFMGEYMSNYAWARDTEAMMYSKMGSFPQ